MQKQVRCQENSFICATFSGQKHRKQLALFQRLSSGGFTVKRDLPDKAYLWSAYANSCICRGKLLLLVLHRFRTGTDAGSSTLSARPYGDRRLRPFKRQQLISLLTFSSAAGFFCLLLPAESREVRRAFMDVLSHGDFVGKVALTLLIWFWRLLPTPVGTEKPTASRWRPSELRTLAHRCASVSRFRVAARRVISTASINGAVQHSPARSGESVISLLRMKISQISQASAIPELFVRYLI